MATKSDAPTVQEEAPEEAAVGMPPEELESEGAPVEPEDEAGLSTEVEGPADSDPEIPEIPEIPEEGALKGECYQALETFVGVYQTHTLRYIAGEIIPERIGKYFYDTGAPVTIG